MQETQKKRNSWQGLIVCLKKFLPTGKSPIGTNWGLGKLARKNSLGEVNARKTIKNLYYVRNYPNHPRGQ
ncbi:MAG: hypothetical protein MRECE_51c007 [Mycoplasmataceae bacterium CE_OT135]|nr:MAG: hypothetical protein MRECE_51c007 [Mycoplasmataceae bacterium CE_OT135]